MKLTLPLPPRNNIYYRNFRGKMHLSTEGRDYKDTVHLLCHGSEPLEGAVCVNVDVYRARKAGDLDGYAKGLLDALNGVAYHDDAQIVELHMRRFDDKHDPRVEVTVEGMGS